MGTHDPIEGRYRRVDGARAGSSHRWYRCRAPRAGPYSTKEAIHQRSPDGPDRACRGGQYPSNRSAMESRNRPALARKRVDVGRSTRACASVRVDDSSHAARSRQRSCWRRQSVSRLRSKRRGVSSVPCDLRANRARRSVDHVLSPLSATPRFRSAARALDDGGLRSRLGLAAKMLFDENHSLVVRSSMRRYIFACALSGSSETT